MTVLTTTEAEGRTAPGLQEGAWPRRCSWSGSAGEGLAGPRGAQRRCSRWRRAACALQQPEPGSNRGGAAGAPGSGLGHWGGAVVPPPRRPGASLTGPPPGSDFRLPPGLLPSVPRALPAPRAPQLPWGIPGLGRASPGSLPRNTASTSALPCCVALTGEPPRSCARTSRCPGLKALGWGRAAGQGAGLREPTLRGKQGDSQLLEIPGQLRQRVSSRWGRGHPREERRAGFRGG